MNEEHPGRAHLDPRLLSLIDETDGLSWLFVNKLQKGDVLEIQTLNTLYTMKVVNSEGEVLVNSNGKRITKEIPANVWGTTLTGTGTMVKMKGITVGLRLVIYVEYIGELILSATQEVRVNGEKVLPKSVSPAREP